MHFEVPKSKKFKEFGGEYVMIVISILTALALEQGLETLHHRHLAHDAAEMMDAELRANIQNVTAVLELNEKKRVAIKEAREQMLAAIRSKIPEAELMTRFESQWRPAMQMSINAPGLRREAWEAAVANQAVTWMARDRLERYAGAYSMLRDSVTVNYNQSLVMLDPPRMLNLASDTQMGVAHPHELYQAMTRMNVAYENFNGNLRNLNDTLKKVVAEGGGGHAGTGHKE